MIEADLLMVPRDGIDPKFVSGVLVQLHDGHGVVSVFSRYDADAKALCELGEKIIHLLREP